MSEIYLLQFMEPVMARNQTGIGFLNPEKPHISKKGGK